MNELRENSEADGTDDIVFFARYKRALHLVFQDKNQDAIMLIADMAEDLEDLDHRLMVYRLWIEALVKENVGRDSAVQNPSLGYLLDHIVKMSDELDNAPSDSFLALAGVIMVTLGDRESTKKLLCGKQWQRTPYTEEFGFLLKNESMGKVSFVDASHETYSSSFSALTSGLRDYCLLKSMVMSIRDSDLELTARLWQHIHSLFGFTLSQGLYHLDEALRHKDLRGIFASLKQLEDSYSENDQIALVKQKILTSVTSWPGSTHFDQEETAEEGLFSYCQNLMEALSHHDFDVAIESYEQACKAFIGGLGDKDLHQLSPADQKVEKTLRDSWHKMQIIFPEQMATEPESGSKNPWLCMLSDGSYERFFLSRSSQQNLLVSMDNKVREWDLVFVTRNSHSGSRLLGIFQVYLALPFSMDYQINKVLRPVLVFDHGQYPSIKLDTREVDSSELIDMKRQFGFEETAALTEDSLAVITEEIRKQTGVNLETIPVFQAG